MTRKGFRSLGAAAILLLVASGAFAAMGNFGSFTFSGFGSSDMVGAGENSTPDGKADAQFAASITGAGALAGLTLESIAQYRGERRRGQMEVPSPPASRAASAGRRRGG